MSNFSYAGVSLALIRTKTFKVEPERDPSGVDTLWPKYTISVLGLLAPTPVVEQVPYNDAAVATGAATAAELAVSLGLDAAVAGAAAQAAGIAAVEAAKLQRKKTLYDYSQQQSPPGTSEEYTAYINAVKARLMTPRQPLFYQCGNIIVRTDGLDANLGPLPVSCNIPTMINGFMLVEFTVTTCLPQCADNPIPSPVVSLKWTQSEAFDGNWLSTIVTRGKLIVRSDMRQSADSFRHLAVPGLLSDYKRESIEFTLNEAGTELGFVVTDQELAVPIPYGATTARAKFTVVVTNGSIRHGQADIALTGPKGSNRADLMAIATRMALSKLESESLLSSLINGSFSEDLLANSVTVSLNSQLAPIKADDRGAIRTAGVTPFVSQGQIPLAPPVRSRLLALVSAPFFDPCSASPGTQPARSTTPSTKITNTNPDGTTTTTTRPGTDAPGTQLVPGGSVGMVPSPAVVAGSVAASTPVGPAALTTGGSAPAMSITVVDEVPDPEVKDAINLTDSAPYDLYRCVCEFGYDSGRVALPGTGVGPDGHKALIVQRHGGLMEMLVTFHIERRILSPIYPRFESPNPNFVGLKSKILTDEVQMSADGRTPIYVVAGWHRYAVIDPHQANVTAAVPPFLSDTAAEAAKLAAGFTSDRVIWQFQDQGGPAPFFAPASEQTPGSQLTKTLGAGLAVAGIPVPPAFTDPEAGGG